MKCIKCGREFSDGNFCPFCGTKVEAVEVSHSESVNEPAVTKAVEVDKTPKPAANMPEKKKSGSRISILVLAIIGIVAVGIILALMFKKDPASSETTDAKTMSDAADITEVADADVTKSVEDKEVLIDEANEAPEEQIAFSIDLEGVTTMDDLDTRMKEDLTNRIESLKSCGDDLSKEINSYYKYCDNKDEVAAFYATIEDETKQIYIALREYTAAYGRMILDDDLLSAGDEAVAELDERLERLYDDAYDQIENGIRYGILKDMEDHFEYGVLKDLNANVEWSEWSNINFAERSQRQDTSFEVKWLYTFADEDIMAFYKELGLYAGNDDLTEKAYNKFLRKIEKRKNKGTLKTSSANSDESLRSASSSDELLTVSEAHVAEYMAELNEEWADLSSKIDTFDKYKSNLEEVEEFYAHIEAVSDQTRLMLTRYEVAYARLILESDLSSEDKRQCMDDMMTYVSNGEGRGMEEIKNKYYDLLDEIKDYFYEGIVEEAKDEAGYSWIRNGAYNSWENAKTEIRNDWEYTSSDLHSFFAELDLAIHSDEIGRANKIIDKFEEKINRNN